jgi:hypothetical protein
MLGKNISKAALILAVLFPLVANAAMQEYVREYTYRVGDSDSKVNSREISMQEIKVELLSELGTYISSRVDISQDGKSKDEFENEVSALTAGFVRVDMLEERWDGETYYLKAKLSADPDDIIKRINELGKSDKESQQDKAKLVAAYEENKKIREELASLRAQYQVKPSEKLSKQYTEESERLSAADMNEAGDDYFFARKGKPRDDKQAVSWYRKAAEQGNPVGQSNLGRMYAQGWGVKQDYAKAVYWYRKAAEQGLAMGQTNLGFMYAEGKGIKQDYAKAVYWYRKAAEQGLAMAQGFLGFMYAEGKGIKQDSQEASFWIQKAAGQGDARLQVLLGAIYMYGDGVRQNDVEAVFWFRKSAEQGNADGQERLGQMYGLGRGVKQDFAQAVFWHRKAAEQGNAFGQHNLGVAYWDGNGIKQDQSRALFWFRLAAEQGNAAAIETLKFLNR